MIKKIGYFIVCTLFAFSLGILVMVVFSPYKAENNNHKQVKESIVVNASVEKTFGYLGNSSNAKEWSVFVTHITTLNPTQVDDGNVGSERRCFSQEDEKGMIWDERIVAVKANIRRELLCYNFQGFFISAGDLITEQLYESVDGGKCKLTFTLSLAANNSTLIDELKLYYAAYKISDVFKNNLMNIQMLIPN